MREKILQEIKGNSFENGLIRPNYNGLSVMNIANSVKRNFGISSGIPLKYEPNGFFERKDFIVMILIDALGYNLISSLMNKVELNGFNKLSEKGAFFPVTSVFPSTTAVALPSISTGVTPSEHGLIGYRFYSKEYGYLINSLFGKPANTEHCKIKIDINWYMPCKTVAEELAYQNVSSYIITRADFLNSHFEKGVYRGFKEVPYLTMSDMFAHITDTLKNAKAPAYINAYWWAVDGLSHRYGPNSSEVINEVILLDKMIENLLEQMPENSLLIVTADHGQITSPPEKTVDLSRNGDISRSLILPVSDLRAPYLYVRGNVEKRIFEKLDDVTVLTNDEAFDLGLFGNSKKFKDRVGDFVLLIRDDKNYAYLSPEEEIKLIGKHGGLTENEMLVPLFLYSS